MDYDPDLLDKLSAFLDSMVSGGDSDLAKPLQEDIFNQTYQVI
jgi:hypothetical protein